jgi:cytochrome c oxidase subunit 2
MILALLQLRGNQSALNPHGPNAGLLAQLSWTSFVLFGMAFAVTMAVLAIALLQARRGRFLDDAQSRGLVLWAGLGVPAVVLLGWLIYSVTVGRTLYAEPYKDRGALTVTVNGKRFWWEIQYLRGNDVVASTANEIHIPVGQPVVFKLTSSDVIHSFWVPTLAGKMDLIPGRTNQMWLQADRPGVYRGQCAEFCGEQHAHMGFEVIAEPLAQFTSWVTRQAEPAHDPADERAKKGRAVLENSPCAMCHQVRGTLAGGRVAPDLTHLASRRYIASGTLPNNRGSLAGWIVNAQGIKPGNHMPRINLDAESLDNLLAYLETLQ